MPTNDFDALMASVEDGWSEEAKNVYSAASSVFRTELAERAEIGACLQRARQDRQMSQQAVSEASGIQQAEISRIERGVANPTIDTLLKACSAVGIRVTLVPA